MPLYLDPRYQVLNERQLAEMLGVGISTLQRWRGLGHGPDFLQLSARRIGYRRSTIEQWLAEREHERERYPSPHDGLNR